MNCECRRPTCPHSRELKVLVQSSPVRSSPALCSYCLNVCTDAPDFEAAYDPADDDISWMDHESLEGMSNQDSPCPVCGELIACAYDYEGRALIHVSDLEAEEGLPEDG